MRLTGVTITGLDERVDIHKLCVLADHFRFVEYGILLSKNQEGNHPRYPSSAWIDNLLQRTKGLRLAGHLCGSWAREAVSGPFLWPITHHEHYLAFKRIQLNGIEGNDSGVIHLIARISDICKKTFIVQARELPRPTVGTRSDYDHVQFLLDGSSGTGKPLQLSPDLVPPTGVVCGYAGGIAPDNIESVINYLVELPSDAPFWIDMESGVRTNDWLDLQKVNECLRIADRFIKK